MQRSTNTNPANIIDLLSLPSSSRRRNVHPFGPFTVDNSNAAFSAAASAVAAEKAEDAAHTRQQGVEDMVHVAKTGINKVVNCNKSYVTNVAQRYTMEYNLTEIQEEGRNKTIGRQTIQGEYAMKSLSKAVLSARRTAVSRNPLGWRAGVVLMRT